MWGEKPSLMWCGDKPLLSSKNACSTRFAGERMFWINTRARFCCIIGDEKWKKRFKNLPLPLQAAGMKYPSKFLFWEVNLLPSLLPEHWRPNTFKLEALPIDGRSVLNSHAVSEQILRIWTDVLLDMLPRTLLTIVQRKVSWAAPLLTKRKLVCVSPWSDTEEATLCCFQTPNRSAKHPVMSELPSYLKNGEMSGQNSLVRKYNLKTFIS